MSKSQRFFAVPVEQASEYTGRPDHTIYLQDADGVDWAEAKGRPITGRFAVVGTTGDPDPGIAYLGGGDPWPKPPPRVAGDESLEDYSARITASTRGPLPER